MTTGMFPCFAPPYGLLTASRTLLSRGNEVSAEKLEELFANELEVKNAILLPSARAGILWGLKACGSLGRRVVCPVFTCTAVWEAVFRAGAQGDGIDLAEEGFLMDEAALAASQVGTHALILSEIYGHSYDLQALGRGLGKQPILR